jgi:5-methylcytosine-specific restriction endonuclease McrA
MEKKYNSDYGVKKAAIISMLEQGISYDAIAKAVHCSTSTISFHAKSIGRPVNQKAAKRYDWDAVQRYYDEGHSARECADHFGFSDSSWSYAVKMGRVRKSEFAMPIEELLVPDREQTSRRHLKQRILRLGLLEPKCAICNITDWLGQPLVLELDHINGKNKDNRIENLRLLCPNCHSQTNTYCGKQAKQNNAFKAEQDN